MELNFSNEFPVTATGVPSWSSPWSATWWWSTLSPLTTRCPPTAAKMCSSSNCWREYDLDSTYYFLLFPASNCCCCSCWWWCRWPWRPSLAPRTCSCRTVSTPRTWIKMWVYRSRAVSKPPQSCRVSLLKVHAVLNSAFIKNLSRHYAKQAFKHSE